MKDVAKLLDYRPEVKVIDATLRDGGLVNNFDFSDEFVKALYETNIRAGVDYMEFGYKADSDMFDKSEFGKWKFCDDEDIRKIVGDNDTDLKLCVMADVGRCNYRKDILPKKDSPLDLIRVATYLHQMPGAIRMIEDAKEKGYEVSCNIMAVSAGRERDLTAALEMLGRSNVDTIYIVDSYGAIYPEEMQRLAAQYTEVAERYGKQVGIHAHNNQQLAFANTIEAVGDGVNWLDATYMGMGRGAGNCQMELLLGFLKNPKYNVYPVIQFLEKYMVELKRKDVVWGYDIQYLITGLLNRHPRSAIRFTEKKREDYTNFYRDIIDDQI